MYFMLVQYIWRILAFTWEYNQADMATVLIDDS